MSKQYEILDVNNNISFNSIYECINAVIGTDYTGWMKACWPNVQGNGNFRIWFPKLAKMVGNRPVTNASGCVNYITDDGNTIIYEDLNERDYTGHNHYTGYDLIFAKEYNGPYIFRGVFVRDSERSTLNFHVRKLISTKVRLVGNPTTDLELLDLSNEDYFNTRKKIEDITSRYTFIKMIDSKKNVSLVRSCDGNNYVQKEYSEYNKNVFEKLCELNIKGIPRFYEVYEKDGRLVTIEEYISGDSLNSVLKDDGLFEEDTVIRISIQLCDILMQIHSLNPPFIHRDIKPSNIMIKRNGELVLIDFNATKEFHENMSQDTVLIGTQYFAAPEQLVGYGSSDERTDIYGIGATMNFLLTEMPPNQMVAPGLLHDIIVKCTKMDKENRYQNVSELKKALLDCL